MTNPVDVARQASALSSIEEAAAAWIERQDRGDWSAGGQSQLDAWLAQSLAHRIAYWRLEAAWSRTERLAALRASESNPVPPLSGNPISRGALKIVAILGVSAMAGVMAAFYFTAPRYQTYATTVGGHETLTLSDGSLIELSTDTVIRVSDAAQLRSAQLEKGEAYFEIKHDPAHPFVVSAGKHRVTDLGTKFLIRNDADRVQVSLLEGRAQFDSMSALGRKDVAVLSPGEVAVATADSMSVTHRPERTLSDALGWRRGLLVFYHTSLADAAAEFNRYNREQLIVGDASTGRLVVNGAFPTNGIAVFTQAAKDIFGVRIERRRDGIVISR